MCCAASAQYSTETIPTPGGITQVADGGTTNCYTQCVIDIQAQAQVGMLLSFSLVGAGTGNVTLTLRPLITTSAQPTHAGNNFTWVVAANGSTVVRAATNFTCYGYGWFELVSVANSGGATMTNISLTYGVKRLAK